MSLSSLSKSCRSGDVHANQSPLLGLSLPLPMTSLILPQRAADGVSLAYVQAKSNVSASSPDGMVASRMRADCSSHLESRANRNRGLLEPKRAQASDGIVTI